MTPPSDNKMSRIDIFGLGLMIGAGIMMCVLNSLGWINKP